jgi:hypothetical protein
MVRCGTSHRPHHHVRGHQLFSALVECTISVQSITSGPQGNNGDGNRPFDCTVQSVRHAGDTVRTAVAPRLKELSAKRCRHEAISGLDRAEPAISIYKLLAVTFQH